MKVHAVYLDKGRERARERERAEERILHLLVVKLVDSYHLLIIYLNGYPSKDIAVPPYCVYWEVSLFLFLSLSLSADTIACDLQVLISYLRDTFATCTGSVLAD